MSTRATAPISTAATPSASARADMDKKEWTMPIATLRGVTLDCADPRALAGSTKS